MVKRIILGLGNPGVEYEKTYHNAGFLALDALVAQRKTAGAVVPELKKYKELFHYRSLTNEVFVWPLTFMNASGKAAREALKKFSLSPKDLVVIHDDSDITLGNYKISFARNSAGHNGVQSIIDMIGTNEFTRIRIGIRPEKETKRKKVGEFALKKITQRDQKILLNVFQSIAKEKIVNE